MNNGNEPISPMYKVLQYGRHSSTGNTTHEPEGGLTKREHFAAMALQGFSSTPYASSDDDKACAAIDARRAVLAADALLEELEK